MQCAWIVLDFGPSFKQFVNRELLAVLSIVKHEMDPLTNAKWWEFFSEIWYILRCTHKGVVQRVYSLHFAQYRVCAMLLPSESFFTFIYPIMLRVSGSYDKKWFHKTTLSTTVTEGQHEGSVTDWWEIQRRLFWEQKTLPSSKSYILRFELFTFHPSRWNIRTLCRDIYSTKECLYVK